MNSNTKDSYIHHITFNNNINLTNSIINIITHTQMNDHTDHMNDPYYTKTHTPYEWNIYTPYDQPKHYA